MTTETALLEPSFLDAIGLIEAADDLPAARRVQWMCSLRQVAKAMDKPLEVIPARYSAINCTMCRSVSRPRRSPTTAPMPSKRFYGCTGNGWLRNMGRRCHVLGSACGSRRWIGAPVIGSPL
jgi:hypothetical protein